MKILDLGCGKDKPKGRIGLDWDKDSAADIICDLNHTLPLKSDIFEFVYCKHLLEHLDNPLNSLNEIMRVSKKGSRLIIEVPHFSSHVAYSDLTHKRYFSYVLLHRLVEKIPHKSLRKEITFYKTFRIFGIKFLANRFKENYERFWTYIFPAENLYFEIEIDK